VAPAHRDDYRVKIGLSQCWKGPVRRDFRGEPNRPDLGKRLTRTLKENTMPTLDFTLELPAAKRESGSKITVMEGSGPVLVKKRPVRVLSASPLAEDHKMLRRILRGAPWNIVSASTYSNAIARLTWDPVSIVVCERDLPGGTWQDVLHHIAKKPEPPLLIVTSKLADEYLWVEVLNLGGYDVLAKPFDEEEVHRVLTGAWTQKVSPIRRVRTAGV
jgi:CheY-like chemotaxis protein